MPDASSVSAPAQLLRVWDLPTRVCHWLLAASVVALVLTAKLDAMDWHHRLGYGVLALLLFRLVWGLVGGRWSRFRSFVYGPGAVLDYLRGRPGADARPGHNPLGALSVFALLGVLLLQVATGLMSDDAISFTGPLVAFVPGAWSDFATHWHKSAGQWLVIGLALLHVGAVLFYVLVKRRRLVRPMLSGDRPLPATPAGAKALPSRDDALSRLAALGLFALCAGLAAWVASLP
jgi:cytochrome b